MNRLSLILTTALFAIVFTGTIAAQNSYVAANNAAQSSQKTENTKDQGSSQRAPYNNGYSIIWDD